MRAETLGIATLILLAGCSGQSESNTPIAPQGLGDDAEPGNDVGTDPQNATVPMEAPSTGPAVRLFEETFSLTLTGAKLSAQSVQVNLENNCVNFGKGSVWLVFNGTATATWTSSTPLDQRLAVEIWDGGGQALLHKNDGSASPSTLAFEQFRITQASTLGFAFIVQPMPDTVVAKLPVKLTISFAYLGLEQTGAKAIPCNPQPRSLEEALT